MLVVVPPCAALKMELKDPKRTLNDTNISQTVLGLLFYYSLWESMVLSANFGHSGYA